MNVVTSVVRHTYCWSESVRHTHTVHTTHVGFIPDHSSYKQFVYDTKYTSFYSL